MHPLPEIKREERGRRRWRRKRKREEKRDAGDVAEGVEKPNVMKDCHLMFLDENQKDPDTLLSLLLFCLLPPSLS